MQMGGRAGGRGGGRRTSGVAALHESARMTRTSTGQHLSRVWAVRVRPVRVWTVRVWTGVDGEVRESCGKRCGSAGVFVRGAVHACWLLTRFCVLKYFGTS